MPAGRAGRGLHLSTTRFINTMKQEPVIEQLLPLSGRDGLAQRRKKRHTAGTTSTNRTPKAVIDELLMRYVEALVYQAVAENMASEQSARMVAMKAASDNARNVIGELKLIYNKTPSGGDHQGDCPKSSAARRPSEVATAERIQNSRGAIESWSSMEKSFSVSARWSTSSSRATQMPNVYDALLEQLGSALSRPDARSCSSSWATASSAPSRMGSSDGLRRGMMVVNTGAPITVPVGQGTLGRIMDVLGRPIDERGPIRRDETSLDPPARAHVRRAVAPRQNCWKPASR